MSEHDKLREGFVNALLRVDAKQGKDEEELLAAVEGVIDGQTQGEETEVAGTRHRYAWPLAWVALLLVSGVAAALIWTADWNGNSASGDLADQADTTLEEQARLVEEKRKELLNIVRNAGFPYSLREDLGVGSAGLIRAAQQQDDADPASRCDMLLRIEDAVSLNDPRPTKLSFTYLVGGRKVTDHFTRGDNWPTGQEDPAFPFVLESTASGRHGIAVYLGRMTAYLRNAGASLEENDSLLINANHRENGRLNMPNIPSLASDLALILRDSKDLTAFPKGFSLLTPYRLYFAGDVNTVAKETAPSGKAIYPPLVFVAPEKRFGIREEAINIAFSGQVNHIGKDGGVVRPLDLKSGVNDEVVSSNIARPPVEPGSSTYAEAKRQYEEAVAALPPGQAPKSVSPQGALHSVASVNLGKHSDGTAWNDVTVQGGVFASKAQASSAQLTLDRLASRKGTGPSGKSRVGGVAQGGNLPSREEYEAANWPYRPLSSTGAITEELQFQVGSNSESLRPLTVRRQPHPLLPPGVTPMNGTGARPLASRNGIEEAKGGFLIREAAINDIFQMLAKRAGKQFVVNPEIAGADYLVRGHLNGGDPDQQMKELATRYGLALHVQGNTVSVKRNGQPKQPPASERYGQLVDQPWKTPWKAALSTFSVDVDTASYSNVRRILRSGGTVPKDSVRIEECINYFDYAYPAPKEGGPFAVHVEMAGCPWETKHHLVKIGLKGKEVNRDARPSSNLVFLIDVSGSMNRPNKLPLLVESMKILVEELDERDSVGLVVYAGSAGIVLEPTRVAGNGRAEIMSALDNLRAGGSTAGAAGIRGAYELAAKGYRKGGVNRVILATDGDFNVGTSNTGELVELVKENAKSGVSLSVLGFGDGNINDAMLEAITNDGNGNYFYIDSQREGRKVFLQNLSGTLVTIAKDVKIQVEFNPGKVAAYRLIGYANRILRDEDFNNDKVDAGDIGAGHTVTALYEIVPAGVEIPQIGGVDALKYQKPANQAAVASPEWMTVKLRYKAPEGEKSTLLEVPVKNNPVQWTEASGDFQFAAGVALFGEKLRHSDKINEASWELVAKLARKGSARDPHGHRAEFLELVQLAGRSPVPPPPPAPPVQVPAVEAPNAK